jgi:dUTP pyrophosphatase
MSEHDRKNRYERLAKVNDLASKLLARGLRDEQARKLDAILAYLTDAGLPKNAMPGPDVDMEMATALYSALLTQSIGMALSPSIRVEARIVNPKLKRMGGLPRLATAGAAARDLVACFPEPGSRDFESYSGYAELECGCEVTVSERKFEVGYRKVSVRLPPGRTLRVPLGFAQYIADPRYASMQIPRSGLGAKGLVLANTVGLFDSDYQGEAMSVLWNRTPDVEFDIEDGMRIAQMVYLPVVSAMLDEVDSFSAETDRGAGAFGSTGAAGPSLVVDNTGRGGEA